VALDRKAHQLVFVAEDDGHLDDEMADAAWRELLFAVSGIRHQLRGQKAPAIATPIVVGVVAKGSTGRLRVLVETLVQEYAIFSRVDLNLLELEEPGEAVDAAAVDRALSSVLPKVRDALNEKVTVAGRDVDEFWGELDEQIQMAADNLIGDFGEARTADAVARVQRVIRGSEAPTQGARLAPICSLDLKNFRSFNEEDFKLAPVTIVSGPNGSGKTSVCESMEILWSGLSRRVPPDVGDHALFEAHLRHKGSPFEVSGCFRDGEPVRVDDLSEEPRVALGRAVLAQEAVTILADGNPKERFRAFLETSGLEIPEFEAELQGLRKDVRRDLDGTLEEAGLVAVHAANETARSVIRRSFADGYAAKLPGPHTIQGAADALVSASGGAYRRDDFRFEPALERLPSLLEDVDATFGRIAGSFSFSVDPGPVIKAAISGLQVAIAALRDEEAPLRRLEVKLGEIVNAPATEGSAGEVAESPVLDPQLASRWFGQVSALEREISALRAAGEEIVDEEWRERLRRYLESLDAAVARSSKSELDRIIAAGSRRRPRAALESEAGALTGDLLFGANFEFSPAPSRSLLAALGELRAQMDEQANALGSIARELGAHPGLAFADHAERVASALCRYELVREIAKPTGAVSKARETLVGRLLEDRLFPIVRELVDALVRFEWYFEPMTVSLKRNQMTIGGLSSTDPGLDVRMMLNAAERSIVGVAWFLALHLTQPEADRRVLVLDDVTGGFDETNKASFVATIRVLARLSKPEQVLITTHDDAFAAILEQELANVDGWPERVGRLRCRRDEDGNSTVDLTPSELATDVFREREMIQLVSARNG
jgi:RecF/RecN/SMC N terminal domain